MKKLFPTSTLKRCGARIREADKSPFGEMIGFESGAKVRDKNKMVLVVLHPLHDAKRQLFLTTLTEGQSMIRAGSARAALRA